MVAIVIIAITIFLLVALFKTSVLWGCIILFGGLAYTILDSIYKSDKPKKVRNAHSWEYPMTTEDMFFMRRLNDSHNTHIKDHYRGRWGKL